MNWKCSQVASKVHFVNATKLRISVVLLILASAYAQESRDTKKVVLYQKDTGCVSNNAKNGPKFITATEARVGKSMYQVFWSHTEPKREVFRVKVGTFVGQDVLKWWNYGIGDEDDFNGDGVPDYTWCGGADTGFAMYLFLSSNGQYQRAEVLKTVQAAWQPPFHRPAPDLGRAGSYALDDTMLERSAPGLVLLAKVNHVTIDGTNKETYQFRIGEADFKP